MRLLVCVSVPLQIMLGVLFTILPVRQIIGYFGTSYSPTTISIAPAFYINSYLSGIYKLVPKSLRTYVANIDSYYVGFLIVLRSYVCRILG